jgi:ribosomal protein L37AE/L43A
MLLAVLKCPNCESENISGNGTFVWCNNCLWAGHPTELIWEEVMTGDTYADESL